jgi:hypothetical protein
VLRTWQEDSVWTEDFGGLLFAKLFVRWPPLWRRPQNTTGTEEGACLGQKRQLFFVLVSCERRPIPPSSVGPLVLVHQLILALLRVRATLAALHDLVIRSDWSWKSEFVE